MKTKLIYAYIGILVILTTQSNNLIGQFRCDTSSQEIFVYTEVLPKMDKTINEIEIYANREIDLGKYDLKEKDLAISSMINCKGEVTYNVLKCNNVEFNRDLIECFMRNIKWTPAEQGGKKVDFSFVFALRIENNRINILADKEMKKLKKKT